MAVTLLSQTGNPTPAPSGTGPIRTFPGTDNIRSFQVNVGTAAPFTGVLEIRGTNKPAPGAGDFQTLVTINFTGHTTNFRLDVQSTITQIQVRLTEASSGTVAVFGDSRTGSLEGGSGTSQSQATAVVSTQLKASVVGQFVHISAPVVPSITSDDVVFASNVNETVTDVLDDLVNFNDTITSAGVTTDDLEILAGVATGTCSNPLTTADLCKLADIDATATQVNHLIGVTSGVQAQLDALDSGKVDGAGVDLTGLTVSATDLNTFFDVSPTVTLTDLNNAFTGLSASVADLNTLIGVAGNVTPSDYIKLGDITASAAEINVLDGVTATTTEINKLAGLTADTADLNVIDGLAASGVTLTEISFLSGLTENVQAALDDVTPLPGLTASVNDLNLLTGAFAGSGAYAAGAISAAELAFLDGVTSNIQTQLDGKRNTADTIGLSEISGATVTTTELNFLSGATSNIQAQIDGLTADAITESTGGDFDPTVQLGLADGTVTAPSLRFTNDVDTGIYRMAPGFNVTVDGVRTGRFDGTFFTVGTGAANGAPHLRGTGFGEANPPYTFVGDEDTGIFWSGADSVSLTAGAERMVEADATAAEVTVGGPAASNNAVVMSGVFAGVKVLGRATVDGTATGLTSLYVVPTARNAIVTYILMRLTNSVVGGGTTPGNPFRMNIGFGASHDEIVDNTSNPSIFAPSYGFDTNDQVMPLGYGDNVFPAISGSSGKDYQVLNAGDNLQADVTVVSDFDDFTFELIVFGHEFV